MHLERFSSRRRYLLLMLKSTMSLLTTNSKDAAYALHAAAYTIQRAWWIFVCKQDQDYTTRLIQKIWR
jgi:hypothetical protein